MYKPKVEFYNHCISLFPWPTDLNMFCSNLLRNVNVPANVEIHSIKNDREIENAVFFLFLLPVTLTFENQWTESSHPP